MRCPSRAALYACSVGIVPLLPKDTLHHALHSRSTTYRAQLHLIHASKHQASSPGHRAQETGHRTQGHKDTGHRTQDKKTQGTRTQEHRTQGKGQRACDPVPQSHAPGPMQGGVPYMVSCDLGCSRVSCFGPAWVAVQRGRPEAKGTCGGRGEGPLLFHGPVALSGSPSSSPPWLSGVKLEV